MRKTSDTWTHHWHVTCTKWIFFWKSMCPSFFHGNDIRPTGNECNWISDSTWSSSSLWGSVFFRLIVRLSFRVNFDACRLAVLLTFFNRSNLEMRSWACFAAISRAYVFRRLLKSISQSEQVYTANSMIKRAAWQFPPQFKPSWISVLSWYCNFFAQNDDDKPRAFDLSFFRSSIEQVSKSEQFLLLYNVQVLGLPRLADSGLEDFHYYKRSDVNILHPLNNIYSDQLSSRGGNYL